MNKKCYIKDKVIKILYNYLYIQDDYEEEKPKARLEITRTSESAKDGTYKEKIEKKVREQAKRLLDLQAYKNLCEQRILQFMPNHALPLLPSHLNDLITKNDSIELNNLKCIIDNKDKVYFI